MLLLALLVCVCPRALGQPDGSRFGEDADSDLAEFELDIVRKRRRWGNSLVFGFSHMTFLFSSTYRRRAGSLDR